MEKWKDKKLDSVSPQKLVKHSLAYGVLAAAILAMTFFGVCTPTSDMSLLPGGKAGKVAGHSITADEFRRNYSEAYNRFQTQYKDQFDPVALDLSGQVLKELINSKILTLEANQNGIVATPNEIDQILLEAEIFKEDGKFNYERLKNYLRNRGHTEKSFEDELGQSIITTKLRQFITDTYLVSDKAAQASYEIAESKLNISYLRINSGSLVTEVTDQEVEEYLKSEDHEKKVKDYYEANSKEFNQEKEVKARHILLSFTGARNATGEAAKRSKEQARKKAEELLAQVKAEGADFEAIAKKSTDEPSGKTTGGSLGFFKKEDMVPEFSEAAFSMTKGEIKGPIESPFGFHIIKVEDIKEGKSQTLDQAKTTIAKRLLNEAKAPVIVKETAEKILSALKDPAKAETAEKLMAEHKLKFQETGEFALNSRYIPGLGSGQELKEGIFTLKNPGDLYDKVLDVGGAKVILKLKEKNLADLKKFAEEKEETKKNQKFYEAYQVYTSLTESFQKDYRDRGLVWENDEFKHFDKTRAQATPGT